METVQITDNDQINSKQASLTVMYMLIIFRHRLMLLHVLLKRSEILKRQTIAIPKRHCEKYFVESELGSHVVEHLT
jgi:hypothetical protein